jgi:hypothetical protein
LEPTGRDDTLFCNHQIAPGGHAVVGGPQLDFPVGKLMALYGSLRLVRTQS